MKKESIARHLQTHLPQGDTLYALTEENAAHAAQVYASNTAYFLLTQGKAADGQSVLEDMQVSVPEGARRSFLGIDRQGAALAVLDVLEGHPSAEVCWIGLLLVHARAHRKGVGRQLVSALMDAAKEGGYRALRLGVIAGNDAAVAFWQSFGFAQIATRQVEHAPGQAAWCVKVMELPLA